MIDNKLCELTELPVAFCAHCRGDADHSKPRATGPTINAHYYGGCTCGCDERFGVGASITYSSDCDGWAMSEHLTKKE